MNILFLTLINIEDINKPGIYHDLIRTFMKNNHNVYVVSPYEKRIKKETMLLLDDHISLLHVKTGNITKCSNLIEKGFSTINIERQYIQAIKKYYKDITFDLVLYSTPPINFETIIKYIKKRDGAKSYLLLKDIFPQNAVDLGMMTTSGLKSVIYKYFRKKEKKLYEVSDKIGCMSKANVEYVLKHNPEISEDKVEVCPNSIEVVDKSVDKKTRVAIRNKYGIPQDKIVFVYGGNLGKPQGISFLIKCLETQKNNDKAFFLIVGSGTEFVKLKKYERESNQSNLKVISSLPKEDYDSMIGACDVGMIFLDHRFTIPNFPSRLLTYMQAGLPVLACTDKNTDIGSIISEGEFGRWCESKNADDFVQCCDDIISDAISFEMMKKNSILKLMEYYDVKRAYQIIKKSVKE